MREVVVALVVGLFIQSTAPPPGWDFRGELAPGAEVRAFAAVDWSEPGHGTPADGPFFAYLLPDGVDVPPTNAVPVDEVQIRPGPQRWRGRQQGPNGAFVRFSIPGDADGDYRLIVCNDPCTTTLGDLVPGPLSVDADAPRTSFDETDNEWWLFALWYGAIGAVVLLVAGAVALLLGLIPWRKLRGDRGLP